MWVKNWGCSPFGEGELGPHLTHRGQGRGLCACQVSSWSIQPFGHCTPTSETDRTDRQTDRQRFDSIGRTVLRTVAQLLRKMEWKQWAVFFQFAQRVWRQPSQTSLQYCTVGSRPSGHYFRIVSVCLSVCLFVCLFVCAEFFSAVFDPISIKVGHMLYVYKT